MNRKVGPLGLPIMGSSVHRARGMARFAAEAVAESLWPTRCALCDRPGAVLCARCAASLEHLDWWRACPRCGAPFGLVQCDLCNPVALGRIGRERLPFAGCASAMAFSDCAGRLVRVYKDQGERRLAGVLAGFMAPVVHPEWRFDAVTFVPATRAAFRRRGFDHAEGIAREVAGLLGVRCEPLLDRPRTRDQRALSGSDRIANLAGRFTASSARAEGRRVLVVDDVFTTGATMCAAADAVLSAGACAVYGLTFARV